MNREPSSHVKRLLRKEVNYGCPVPNCGNPFLTWHHFDPPWHKRQHHDVEGMIALCTRHHPMADVGTFSIEQLRAFKRDPNPMEFVRNQFEWMPEHCIIRLGGCYAADWCEPKFLGLTVLCVKEDEYGNTSISFVLKDSDDLVLASMTENIFSCATDLVHDLLISASGNHVRVWISERKIGFEASYSRKTPVELESFIAKDQIFEKKKNVLEKKFNEALDFMQPPTPIKNLDRFYQDLSKIQDPLEIAAIGMRRNDNVGTFLRWHFAKHIAADGKIPFLNFISCRLHNMGRCLELYNGKLGGLEFCMGNTFNIN